MTFDTKFVSTVPTTFLNLPKKPKIKIFFINVLRAPQCRSEGFQNPSAKFKNYLRLIITNKLNYSPVLSSLE